MRETRLSGSEGGAGHLSAPSLPLSSAEVHARGYIGNASSVLIRVHPWLLTPRSDSGGLSFVSLGVHLWLPGLIRVFRAFRGPATGLAVIASSGAHFRQEPNRFPEGQPLSSTPVK